MVCSTPTKGHRGAPELDTLLFHNFHAPDEVRVFTVPHDAIQRHDNEALVYDVRVGSDLVLRHYSWSKHWFEVNCTFSCQGALVEEHGPMRWAFNCDISTPHVMVGTNAYNMDLELDVLVSADGARHVVKDRQDFSLAVHRGWIHTEEARGAERGLVELLLLVQSGRFRPFLEAVCPFATLKTSVTQPAAQRKSLDEVPSVQREWRTSTRGSDADAPPWGHNRS